MKSKVLYKVLLKKDHHYRTGEVKHYVEDNLIEELPLFLQIEYWVDGEYYLIHYDQKEEDMLTDTLHDSIEEAMRQGELEFNIKPHEWEKMS